MDESKKVTEEYAKANTSIIQCFDGAQEKKSTAMLKSKELENKVEAKKNLIRGKFLKIQGKVSTVVQKLRTSLGTSSQSTEKIVGLNKEIENAQQARDHSKVDYRNLYKKIETCLTKQNDDIGKDLKGIKGKIEGWYARMESLTEQMDCELISKKELHEINVERKKIKQEIESIEIGKKKVEEEINQWKKKANDGASKKIYCFYMKFLASN